MTSTVTGPTTLAPAVKGLLAWRIAGDRSKRDPSGPLVVSLPPKDAKKQLQGALLSYAKVFHQKTVRCAFFPSQTRT